MRRSIRVCNTCTRMAPLGVDIPCRTKADLRTNTFIAVSTDDP